MIKNKFSRRDFLKALGLFTAGGLVFIMGLLAVKDESEQPVVDVVEVPIKDLPAAFNGFTIAQLSDIHLDPTTQAETVQRAVELANQFQPDLVALTGDYVWQDLDAIYDLTAIFSNLKATYGVVAIMGNHDIWLDAGTIKSAFTEAGLPMLVNKGFPIQRSGTEIYIAGLDDGWSGQPDLDQALTGVKENVPVILLFHEPDLVDQVAVDGRVSLMLSGHTHGGQVRINGKRPPIQPYLGTKYDIGLHQVGSTYLYVNRGIGNISIPLRINCPPEVTRLILRKAG